MTASTGQRPEPAVSGVAGGRAGYLLATVFCSGASVMIVEMTAVRVLTPFFGSTNYVWTNVIAVVLAALAVGYTIGGRVADKRPSPTLLYGLLAAGGLLVAVASWLASDVSRLFVQDGLNLEGVATMLARGSLGATLILFAPATLLLGMVSPLAIRLLSEQGVGRAAGSVFAVSTLGSILGTYLPILYLVPQFGSRGSLFVAAGLLLLPAVPGLILSARGRGSAMAAVAVILTSGVTAIADMSPSRGTPRLANGGKAQVLAEVESSYQYLTVREDTYPNGTTEQILTLNEGIYTYHSFRVKGQVLTNSRYYDDYALLPFLLDLPPGSELRTCVVGFACGINATQWRHFWEGPYRVVVDGAELDPKVVELGREFFDLPAEDADWLTVYTMDGRQMLEALPKERAYHILVVDAFSNELYIPFHLGTREFFELCRSRLEPGGILAMNVYAVGLDSPNLRALQNTLATVFGACVRLSQNWGSNYILIARNGEDTPDMTRLAPVRIRARWGNRSSVTEWGDLMRNASWVPGHSSRITPVADEWVLTDDRAPLEFLTDRFIERLESEVLGD